MLEVLLVLVIMGLTVSYVMFNAFGKSSGEELEKEVQRFQVVVDMASDFAVLNQLQMGVRIDKKENQYLFMFLDDDQRWQPIENEKAFSAFQLPEQFSLDLQLDGLDWIDEESLFDDGIFDESLSLDDDEVRIGDEEELLPPPPQILILPSGEITPFSVTFIFEPDFTSEDPVYYRVNGVDSTPLEREGPLESL